MTLQELLGLALAIGLALLLLRKVRSKAARDAEAVQRIFAPALELLADARMEPDSTAGVHRLSGSWQGLPVQVQTVTDTLAVRKLPSLWLMVTIPDPLPLRATFDLMLRPAGATTFSNFDLLPHGVTLPHGFPEQAVLRTDDPRGLLDPRLVLPHVGLIERPRAKELLISPRGLRLVTQLAEADRARYGVFRQADFGDVRLAPEALEDMLAGLAALRQAIIAEHESEA